MKKLIPKIISMLLVIAIICVIPAMASSNSPETIKKADVLYNLGLFKGTTAGYELDKIPTRVQGLVMLIRLLGEEDKALSSGSTHPFSDVPSWADNYVGYAISKGYTKGTGISTFSPDLALDSKSYVTFVLRSLGYDDSNGDFSWTTALDDSTKLGLMTSAAASALSGVIFNRGDMVDISYSALTMPLKGEAYTLAQKLAEAGLFTIEQGKTNGVIGNRITYTYVPYDNSTVEYARKTVYLP